MPNWVTNTLKCYIRQPEEFLADMGKEHDVLTHDLETASITTKKITCREPFCFWNIISPQGEELVKYEASYTDSNIKYDTLPDNIPEFLASWTPYWYGWNIAHWGTKWEPSDVEISIGFVTEITFNTAWSPPLEAIRALAMKYPDDEFHLRYVEEQGWGGFSRFKADKWLSDADWGIPSSHRDAVMLESYCSCFDGFDAPFNDCPPALPKGPGGVSTSAWVTTIEVVTS